MRQKICAMRRWHGGKEKITIYLDTEKFDRIKKKFQLPRNLNFRIIRWWQDSESLLAFYAPKIINALSVVFPLKRFYGLRLVLSRYDWLNKIIKIYIDKIWLLSCVNDADDFINEFCSLVAHEAKHSKDIRDKVTMQVYLASAESARSFEKAADDFAEKHKAEFQKIFVFEVKKEKSP